MRLIIYTGKGGTGKTVSACSTAILIAEKGSRTLLLSSDPAHTLADALIRPDLGTEPKEVIPNLQAVQVDPLVEMNKHYSSILSYAASMLHTKGLDETLAYELAMLPGMTQLFSLLMIENVARTKSFDTIVLDMAASGEALRYLFLPKIAGSVGRKLSSLAGVFSGFSKIFQPFAKASGVPEGVLENELELLDRLGRLSKLMVDRDQTTIRLVVNPDTFSIENAKRTFMSASLYGMSVDLVVINKIMPVGSPDPYYSRWAESQRLKVENAKASFYPLPVREVKLYDNELIGVDMLRENGRVLFETSHPAEVLFKGDSYRFHKEGSSFLMNVKVPFTKKDDFDVERYGDQITIKVKNQTGFMINTIPLPAITFNMKLSKAKLVGDELVIIFEDTAYSGKNTKA
ncbi:ArsA family ATPase [Nitrososphaera sp. AFS]|jgi:arsenite-transporting ATPase|uniref:ArsA family ATPase n=1 Tax=Nitrososphaera sp. AFS TaxID=2301191 RepID=UPI0013923474|nr:ArsA family ATPase [Nitrososphaera sp. AFS]NAL76845.1 ArsA family ATPase [Nitrososphaera sp. AFS]